MHAALFPDVTVNGETISAATIAAEAQNHHAPKDKPGWAWRKAARALAVRALLLQEAARRGLSPELRDLGGGRRETGDEALIRALLEAELPSERPDEAAIRAAYDAAPERFRSPALFEAAHILFAAPAGDAEARAEARARADAAIARLRRDPEAFDRLAAQQSDCPSRAAGGRLGQVSSGETVPEFEAALATLAPGEMASEPVETRYGLHIVRLDAQAKSAVLPFEAVRPHIAETLEKANWTRAAASFVARLVQQAKIEGVTTLT